MSTTGNRLTRTLESHPRLTGAVFATLALLTTVVGPAVAGSGVNTGP